MTCSAGGPLKMRQPLGSPALRGEMVQGGPDAAASGVYMRTAGGIAMKPGATRVCQLHIFGKEQGPCQLRRAEG
jgi:hypothetical protein